jgi:2Fe-2S ferredoxin
VPKITYIQFDGVRREVEIKAGTTVMEGAVRNGVAGVEAECGGACSCATCHVQVDTAWRERTGAPGAMERDLLDFAPHAGPGSRLSCQIKVTDALDGLVVRIPESQS